VGAGKFRQPVQVERPNLVDDRFFLSMYVDDGIFRHPHVVLLRHSWLL
jgi:hypothetical protein